VAFLLSFNRTGRIGLAAMENSAAAGDLERLSELIGAIYDCAVDPGRWDKTLGAMCDLLDCTNGVLYLAEFPSEDHRLQKIVGIDSYWAERLGRHGPDIAELHSAITDYYTRPLNLPFVCSRDIAADVWCANGYYREWAKPQGIVDVIDTILMRQPHRFASCALGRHESFGLIGEREIMLARLIAPHLRRAVTISDLIDMKTVERDALGATFDALAVGVVLVAEDSLVIHANRAAERLFARAGPVRCVDGRIGGGSAEDTERLRRTIGAAVRGDAEIGTAGLGMALGGGGDIATVHVLPLARGDLRVRLMPGAAAALFVASGAPSAAGRLTAVAEAYGLTPAETRLLERLAAGETIDEAAESLDIARTTAKTHLARVLSKTGSRRQTDLLGLVHRLMPAVMVTDDRMDGREEAANIARNSTARRSFY
jgi:DNA-binding CsgD family transcriptional regulator/PAS domain-containing protein